MSKITELITELARPIVEEEGCELWDVEYVKEAGTRYLRLLIDKIDGDLSTDDCAAISHKMDPILDEVDPIPESYVFEVGSAGADRELKRPGDFDRFMGSDVEVRLYQPLNGRKAYVGMLAAYQDGSVTISADGKETVFTKQQIAQVRLYVKF